MSDDARLFQGLATDPQARAARMARFVGSVQSDDAEMIAFWRGRTAAEHARAGAEISDAMALLATQRGLVPARAPMSPGLSTFLRR